MSPTIHYGQNRFSIYFIFQFNRNEQFERENPANGRRPSELEHERNNDVSAAENLDNIDQNLKSIENHIIDDTIKYTGSKQGMYGCHRD